MKGELIFQICSSIMSLESRAGLDNTSFQIFQLWAGDLNVRPLWSSCIAALWNQIDIAPLKHNHLIWDTLLAWREIGGKKIKFPLIWLTIFLYEAILCFLRCSITQHSPHGPHTVYSLLLNNLMPSQENPSPLQQILHLFKLPTRHLLHIYQATSFMASICPPETYASKPPSWTPSWTDTS